MVTPSNHPGHWQHFILRNDNRGLTTEQMRQKYLKEQLLFENYISFVQQQQLLMSNAASGGGPLPLQHLLHQVVTLLLFFLVLIRLIYFYQMVLIALMIGILN